MEKSLFWKIYKTVLLVLCAIVAVSLLVMVFMLKAYEKAQPKYVAEEVFNEYFANIDAEKYISLCNENGAEIDNVEEIAEYLEDLTSGKEVEYYRVSTGVDDCLKYIVKSDGEKFASFKLVKDEEQSGLFTHYKATDFEITVKGGEKITVEVPEGYKLFVNDKEISEDKITEKDIETEAAKFLPEGEKGILYNKYTVSGLLSSPTVKVTDAAGTEALVTENNGSYHADIIFTNSLKEEYNDWILKGMKRYSEYMQHSSNNPVSFNEISVYFDPSSDLYENIRTEENMFVWDYDSFEYENDDTTDYIKYSDNCFSCICRFVQILHKSGEEDYKDTVDVTLYLRNVDGQFLICNMSQN